MKLKNTLLVVRDMAASVTFYRTVLGLQVTADFGANVTMTGDLSLQTLESWKTFIDADGASDGVRFFGNDAELYFETADFDAFAASLSEHGSVRLVHPVKEHRWGQRVVRFYDPDGHIIEVGEALETVAKRFASAGMDAASVAERMDIPLAAAKRLLK